MQKLFGTHQFSLPGNATNQELKIQTLSAAANAKVGDSFL
jgi:hypothetical protein